MNQLTRVRHHAVAFGLAWAFALGGGTAHAQDSNSAAAEALFQAGLDLYDKGRYAEACPKLAESQRLDPATGTLLTLALCHEQAGNLASAWAAFVDVQARAERDGRADRQQVASEHAAALRPRLSTLTIEVPADVAALPNLSVSNNGAELGKGSFGIPIPKDGGQYRIEVTAPGREPWTTTLRLERASDHRTVSVPGLRESSAPAASVGTSPAPPAPERKPSPSGWPLVGFWVTAVGAVGLGGTAVGFGVAAGDANSKAETIDRDIVASASDDMIPASGLCNDPVAALAEANYDGDKVARAAEYRNACDLHASETKRGDRYTTFAIASGVGAGVLAAAAVVFLVITPSAEPKSGATSPALEIAFKPAPGGGAGTVLVTGRW